MAFDLIVVEFLHRLAGKFAALDVLALFSARILPYAIAVAFLALVAWSFRESFRPQAQRLHAFLIAALAILVAWGIIASSIHVLYPRPRPFVALGWEPLMAHPATPSFPSSHATIVFALAATGWLVNRRWGWYFYAAAALVALARVYAGLHWPSDVLAGAIIGIATIAVLYTLIPPPYHGNHSLS